MLAETWGGESLMDMGHMWDWGSTHGARMSSAQPHCSREPQNPWAEQSRPLSKGCRCPSYKSTLKSPPLSAACRAHRHHSAIWFSKKIKINKQNLMKRSAVAAWATPRSRAVGLWCLLLQSACPPTTLLLPSSLPAGIPQHSHIPLCLQPDARVAFLKAVPLY